MGFSPLKFTKRQGGAGIRLAVSIGCLSTALLGVVAGTDSLRPLHSKLGSPMEFRARELLKVSPDISPHLKIFALDDSAYARLKKPYLSGIDWAEILTAIGASQPRAIVTTHMFGTGEFAAQDDALSGVIRKLRESGVAIVAGAFVSPRAISFRAPLTSDHVARNRPLRRDPVSIPGGKFYGPEAAHAHKFTSLGHLAYDGSGRIPVYLQTEAGTLPHISYAVADLLAVPLPKSEPSSTHEPINFPSTANLTSLTKSLKAFLGADGRELASRVVKPDDIVLILSDMYTGKVNFANTPGGSIPSGYIVASLLNSLLTGQHLHDRSDSVVFVLLFLLVGLSCGLAPGAGWFAASFAGGLLVIPTLGILSFSVSGIVLPWVTACIFFSVPALVLYVRRTQIRLNEIRQHNIQVERETEKLNAIVRTAQMFAHDVRKPFSMLNMATQSIRKMSDTNQIVSFMNRMLPELERSMSTVEGMIHDIMEIDSQGSVSREDTGTAMFLLACLRDVFVLRDARDISLDYKFGHTLDLSIDRLKVRRVLVNIIDNAVAAMNGKGRLWVSTCDATENGMSFVEITIGNSGSWIPPENLKRIFEAFYTSGKKGGTGLGLAIAQKVIHEHGGSISARSGRQDLVNESGHNNDWTEFVFTLPAAFSTPSEQGINLFMPRSSDAFISVESLPRRDDASEANDEARLTAAKRMRHLKNQLGRKVRVLVIDDEDVYLESMRTILSGGEFSGLIELQTAESSSQTFEVASSFVPDLILCDIDLGPESTSGFEVVARLRKDGISAHIVMHSNRIFQLDSTRAAEAGADGFLSKPINEIKLMNTIIEGVGSASQQAAAPDMPSHTKAEREVVVVVDDDIFALEAWEAILDDATLRTFSSPTAFWNYLAAHKAFINDIKLVVTDYYFDNETHETGETFARRIKEIGNIPVMLSSNGSFPQPPDCFDAVIGKEPDTWIGLKVKLKSHLKAG